MAARHSACLTTSKNQIGSISTWTTPRKLWWWGEKFTRVKRSYRVETRTWSPWRSDRSKRKRSCTLNRVAEVFWEFCRRPWNAITAANGWSNSLLACSMGGESRRLATWVGLGNASEGADPIEEETTVVGCSSLLGYVTVGLAARREEA